ncbi:hypothetical protein PROP_03093 [Propionicimonas sp. T2.31MG-18]|uniref:hypothetical protein n=1 Tax=Propionicimonas sp. T2.31MG-18 TaxID=3157620 RepID=UPI0035E9870F
MATVDALLAALRERTQELALQQHNTPDPSTLGWHRLARNSMRILQTVGTPPELAPILRAVVDEAEPADGPVNAPITAMGYTLGVLADTVNSHPEFATLAGHADRAHLRFCVLSGLHDAATATLTAMHATSTSTPSRDLIRALAEVTEAASYVPWRPLRTPLGQLALGAGPSGFDEVAAAWAASAIDVLSSRTRTTGYAFQRTAFSIAQLCQAAAIAFTSEHAKPTGPRVEAALTSARQDWQRAADWPPEVRLGGHATELRHRSHDLDEALAPERLATMDDGSRLESVRSALLLATEVGTSHESALARVVQGRELWIVAQALGPAYLTRHPGTHRTDWVLDPGTIYGPKLIQAVHRANAALEDAAQLVDEVQRTDVSDRLRAPMRWETVTASTRAVQASQAVQQRQGRSIGR